MLMRFETRLHCMSCPIRTYIYAQGPFLMLMREYDLVAYPGFSRTKKITCQKKKKKNWKTKERKRRRKRYPRLLDGVSDTKTPREKKRKKEAYLRLSVYLRLRYKRKYCTICTTKEKKTRGKKIRKKIRKKREKSRASLNDESFLILEPPLLLHLDS